MNAKEETLVNVHNAMIIERRNITEICEVLRRLTERVETRATEVDEHARRIGDLLHNARMVAGEEPQQQAAIVQARNDAKAALGPMFARDLWRELSECWEVVGIGPTTDELNAYLMIVAWMFDRPIDRPAGTAFSRDANAVFDLNTTDKILAVFPELEALLGLAQSVEPEAAV